MQSVLMYSHFCLDFYYLTNKLRIFSKKMGYLIPLSFIILQIASLLLKINDQKSINIRCIH